MWLRKGEVVLTDLAHRGIIRSKLEETKNRVNRRQSDGRKEMER